MQGRGNGVLHCCFYSVPGKSRSYSLTDFDGLTIPGAMAGDTPYGGLAGYSGNGFLAISGVFPMLAVGVFVLLREAGGGS